MRTTKAEVTAVFKMWVESVGGHLAKDYSDVGGYQLDHNSVYGGYQIVQIVNERGGQSDSVFLTCRLTAFYFVQAMRGAIRSMEAVTTNKRLDHVTHCPKMGAGCAHFTKSGAVK